jgi:hypothetical protein
MGASRVSRRFCVSAQKLRASIRSRRSNTCQRCHENGPPAPILVTALTYELRARSADWSSGQQGRHPTVCEPCRELGTPSRLSSVSLPSPLHSSWATSFGQLAIHLPRESTATWSTELPFRRGRLSCRLHRRCTRCRLRRRAERRATDQWGLGSRMAHEGSRHRHC